ncbi:glycine--tRNA ligase [Candidatus Bathyarchaeota archaeon A05DMB-2]|jgi:glycyl-tRNA synthetase|nr:glycine--tRNA ligase [Candidatus Bathyarchaeota archaeon A05DMB-2]
MLTLKKGRFTLDNEAKQDKFTAVNELARRRGFFWQSYEIYGGAGGFVTYGPLGSRLKQNIEAKLRELFITKLGILEIESSVITPGKVFEASGHVDHFKEPMVECSKCHKRFRADHLLEEYAKISSTEAEKMSLDEIRKAIEENGLKCPDCGGGFNAPQQFLTMFETTIGPYSGAVGYGRPEAAQGIFVEFNRLYAVAREKLPFGVIQIGHALRNEISPRQGLIRLREFTIADLEFFFDPEETDCCLLKDVENETLRLYLAEERLKCSEKTIHVTVKEAVAKQLIRSEWQAFFMAMAKKLLTEIGVPAEKQRFIEKTQWEKAHYASQSFDQEVYVDRWGWIEVSGHAYRTDFDLSCHMKASGVDMHVYKEYKTPVEKEEIVLKPIMAKLGPVFKKEAAKVAELLQKAPTEEVAASLEKQGFYMVEDYKILPEYVDASKQKTVVRGTRFIPHVVEPSFGCDRLFYAALEYAYGVKDDRVVMSFPRSIAPIQVGVYPLVSKDGLVEKAREVHRLLANEGFMAEFDETGSIGRRYARADEAGVPLGITIDYDTLSDNTVTIRDRDSWRQVRSSLNDLPELLHRYFQGKIDFEDLGTLLPAK